MIRARRAGLLHGVSFPILEKQNVNGPKRSPLYRFLVDSEAGGGKDIEWTAVRPWNPPARASLSQGYRPSQEGTG